MAMTTMIFGSFVPNLSPVVKMGLVVLALLTAASGSVAALRRIQPDKDYSEFSARVWSWWGMAGIFPSVLAPGHKTALVFFAFLSFWALKEYLTLLKPRPADHRALVLSFLALPAQYYLVAIGWYGMFIIFIPVYVFLCLPVVLALSRETRGFVASVSQIQLGLIAFVFGL